MKSRALPEIKDDARALFRMMPMVLKTSRIEFEEA